APQMSSIVAPGMTNRSRQLFRERWLTINITATKWLRFRRRSLYSTLALPCCEGSMTSCLIAGAGPVGAVNGDAQPAWMQRPPFLGGNVSAGCGLASVSEAAITIPALTANHGVSMALRTTRPKFDQLLCPSARARRLTDIGSPGGPPSAAARLRTPSEGTP